MADTLDHRLGAIIESITDAPRSTAMRISPLVHPLHARAASMGRLLRQGGRRSPPASDIEHFRMADSARTLMTCDKDI